MCIKVLYYTSIGCCCSTRRDTINETKPPHRHYCCSAVAPSLLLLLLVDPFELIIVLIAGTVTPKNYNKTGVRVLLRVLPCCCWIDPFRISRGSGGIVRHTYPGATLLTGYPVGNTRRVSGWTRTR